MGSVLRERKITMNRKFPHYLLLLLILILIGLIIFYVIDYKEFSIKKTAINEIVLNQTQEDYIKANDTVSIYVEEDLRYLLETMSEGFLYDYMNGIFSEAGVSIELTDKKDADCKLLIVTDKIRKDYAVLNYTSPILQIDGAIFFDKNSKDKEVLSGIVMDDRLTDLELQEIRYGNATMSYSDTKGAKKAVETARRQNKDFIIGDRNAIIDEMNGNIDYIAAEESLYQMNVCILTNKNDSVLYSILNECIHQADRHSLSYEAGQRWMNGNGPIYMKDSYEDIYLLTLIIFLSVVIVFFLYYQANKNLYRELDDRMVQLTESKQELKTTFNGVGYYIAELDLTGNIIDINRAFFNFVDTDTVGKKIWDALNMSQKGSNRLKELVLRAKEGTPPDSIEVLLKKQTLVMKIFPIENVKGSVEKLLFMGMDVTSERAAESQLLQDNKMIAIGQLAAGVAHEIRNPLGIIRNYCYVLKTIKNPDIQAKAIEQIEKAVDNSGLIINDLLDFSRTSSYVAEQVNIEQHIRSFMLLNQSTLKKKNINLKIICPDEVNIFLPVQSLNMILINLISNATDAMDNDGNLTISVLKYDETVEIKVQDTGTGIEQDVLDEIFNPFFTTKEISGGTGLGLYIVYNEVNKINGEISVKSVIGEGTTFKLILPLNNSYNNDREESSNE